MKTGRVSTIVSSKMDGISGMGDNDPGALTVEQQSQLNDFKVRLKIRKYFLFLRTQICFVLDDELYMSDFCCLVQFLLIAFRYKPD